MSLLRLCLLLESTKERKNVKKIYYYYHFVFDCLNKFFKENQIKIKLLGPYELFNLYSNELK